MTCHCNGGNLRCVAFRNRICDQCKKDSYDCGCHFKCERVGGQLRNMYCRHGYKIKCESCHEDTSNWRKYDWVSVKNKLPPDDGEYIVVIDGRIDVYEFCSYKRESWWQNYNKDYKKFVDERVTFWMPLPEIPKE